MLVTKKTVPIRVRTRVVEHYVSEVCQQSSETVLCGWRRIIRYSVNFFCYILYLTHAVVQLVEAMRYKLEGRGFDSQMCN
jgi:hypothetical protein